VEHATVKWNPEDQYEAEQRLAELAQVARQRIPNLSSIAVASFGPFLSLIPSNTKDYGRLHPDRAHKPFMNTNFPKLLGEAIQNLNLDAEPYLSLHTDASACAIGEAMTRDIPLGKVVASLVIGKGIGLGLVQNYYPIPSALHPEIGLLPAPSSPREIIETSGFQTKSLAERVANDAMCKRAGVPISELDDHPEALAEVKIEFLWDLRAEYLADACLACCAICPPDFISLHPYIDPLGDLGERTSAHFTKKLDNLAVKEQPVFRYEDLQDKGFISNTRQTQALTGASIIASTGAMGMCYAAAEHAFKKRYDLY
jgi:hypothetical protein